MNKKRIFKKIIIALLLLVPIYSLGQFFIFNMKYMTEETIIFGWNQENMQFQIDEKRQFELNGIDGPYLINDTLYYVDEKNTLIKSINIQDSLRVQIPNKDKSTFYFSLNKQTEKDSAAYPMPKKLIAISDIEGNFDAFYGFLQKNGVINPNFNWIFGKNHLVLNGDFVDRGEHVTPVLWLVYKLEQEAKKHGGKVHFVLGNHEIMNFQGKYKYANPKYIKLAQLIAPKETIKESYKILYSQKSEIGKWLRSKNISVKIGDYLFVHAGLSPEIISLNLTLQDMNEITRKNWDKDLYNNPENDSTANFLLGRKGPFWYRGLVTDYKHYNKATPEDLEQLLNLYQVQKIVVGHSIVDAVSTDYNGKVIRIDVKHGHEKYSPKTQGLLIENGFVYKVDATGHKQPL